MIKIIDHFFINNINFTLTKPENFLLLIYEENKLEINSLSKNNSYYNFLLEDDLTNKFKKNFDYFKNITHLSDEKVINLIRSDGIHVLIDLAGYTLNNRLSIFFYNPAPVQVSMLGYLPTTGIKEIKYKIGDNNIYPKSIEKTLAKKY